MDKLPHFNIKKNPPEYHISDAEKIRAYLAEEQRKLANEFKERQKGVSPEQQITISADFRIEPPSQAYLTVQKKLVDEHLSKNHGSSNPVEIAKDENQRAGFMFEILKTSILHKKIGERFIVVRSSHYDDIVNKVDNVLVDRKNGHTVCALDEVSPKSMQDDEMNKKRKEIKGRNFGFEKNCGMTLKYGIILTEGKISCKEINNLPIFLLSLDHTHLNEGLSKFQNGKTASEYEDKLFRYFLSSLSLQIQELKLNPQEYKKLPADMRSRIESLESFLEETKLR